MEDMCQISERSTDDKYKSSYEKIAKLIKLHSSAPMLDLANFWEVVVFSWITGNSDMHLKNFSLIETSAGSQVYQLSEAYDLLPVNVIIPEDDEQLALTVNGKKHNIRRNDFLKFADSSGISREAAIKMIQKIQSMRERYLKLCEESWLPESMKERFCALIEERLRALG
jgi:serine/threonine-protein kinase HipA